jgi:hypothetical protein
MVVWIEVDPDYLHRGRSRLSEKKGLLHTFLVLKREKTKICSKKFL